ncbi:hypothetical protein FHG87_025639 [Trinorchestia longiramus]|nr:hypothetical protein FHG87_025639 [Trinorchestia longiramus]
MNKADDELDPDDVLMDEYHTLEMRSKSSAHTVDTTIDEYPGVSGITTARDAMRNLSEEDKEKIATQAARGISIISAIDSSPLILLNQDFPILLPSNGNLSFFDLTIVSSHLALETSWTPLTRLNSDHLSIIASFLPTNQPPFPTTSPQDFHQYQQSKLGSLHTEELFYNAPLPFSCTQGEAFIRLTLQTTAHRFIPRGCRKDFIPNLPPSAIPLINQRDLLRSTNPNDPCLPNLNNNITSAISTHSRQTWMD